MAGVDHVVDSADLRWCEIARPVADVAGLTAKSADILVDRLAIRNIVLRLVVRSVTARLVLAGLATVTTAFIRAGGPAMRVDRYRITAAGRRAIEG
jgi:hypothetical protein